MKLEILKETENPLLNRKRVTLQATYQGNTPSRKDFRKAVATTLKAQEALVAVKHIYTRFGNTTAKVICNVYQDEKTLQQIEEEHIVKRHTGEQKEGTEQPAEATAVPEQKAEKKPEAHEEKK